MEDQSPLVDYVPHLRKSALTFGLEIEFALATMPISGIDPKPFLSGRITGMPDRKSTCEDLRQTLEDAGILVEVPDFGTWSTPNHQSWTVKYDGTIMAPDNIYSWEKIEVTSPSFYFTPGSLEQVPIVLETLARTYRISCNRSCGLHVHVGNGLKGFRAQTIRNLMATIWTFEPQISTVHPEHRQSNQRMAPNFRKNSELSHRFSQDPRKGLELLLSASANTMEEIKHWSRPHGSIGLPGGGKLAYHLGDVSGERDLSDVFCKRTIEFREHGSTLNKHAVQSWIEFCVHLVEFADDVTEDILFPFLRQHITDTPEQYSIKKLLYKLGMAELAVWYTNEITRRETREAMILEWNKQRVKEGKSVHDEAELWFIMPSGKIASGIFAKSKMYGKSTIY